MLTWTSESVSWRSVRELYQRSVTSRLAASVAQISQTAVTVTVTQIVTAMMVAAAAADAGAAAAVGVRKVRT
jgi:hypothetical protein